LCLLPIQCGQTLELSAIFGDSHAFHFGHDADSLSQDDTACRICSDLVLFSDTSWCNVEIAQSRNQAVRGNRGSKMMQEPDRIWDRGPAERGDADKSGNSHCCSAGILIICNIGSYHKIVTLLAHRAYAGSTVTRRIPCAIVHYASRSRSTPVIPDARLSRAPISGFYP
jgi:hypothetical protein